MKKILFYIGHFLSLIFTPKMSYTTQAIKRYLYTGYYSHRFKHFGKRSFIIPHVADLRGEQYISIGEDCVLFANIELTAWDKYNEQWFTPSITIGNGCIIKQNSHITAINHIEIGDNLLTGPNILITDNSHGGCNFDELNLPPTRRNLYSKGGVKIGNNVWLGEGVSIMPNVTIGDGVTVAAHSVVTHDLPAYCIAAGVPAKIINK